MISKLGNSVIHTSPVRKVGDTVFIDTNDNGVLDRFSGSEPVFADNGHYRALKSQPGSHDNVRLLGMDQQYESLDRLASQVTGRPLLSVKGCIEVDHTGEMAFQVVEKVSTDDWLSPYSTTGSFNPYLVFPRLF